MQMGQRDRGNGQQAGNGSQGGSMGGRQQENEFGNSRYAADRGGYGMGYERGGFELGRGGFGRQGSGFGFQAERGGQGRAFGIPDVGRQERGRGNVGQSARDFGRTNQSFVGKGPKGYARSDERIREEICELLSVGYLDASDIEVVVVDGEVNLSGTVADRRTKRLAEEIVDSAQGVKDIENRLKVKAQSQDRTEDAASSQDQRQEGQRTQRQEGQSGNFNSGSRESTPSSASRSFV